MASCYDDGCISSKDDPILMALQEVFPNTKDYLLVENYSRSKFLEMIVVDFIKNNKDAILEKAKEEEKK